MNLLNVSILFSGLSAASFDFITNGPEYLSDDFDLQVADLMEATKPFTGDGLGFSVNSIMLGNQDDDWVRQELEQDDLTGNLSETGLARRQVGDACAIPTCADSSDPGVKQLANLQNVQSWNRFVCRSINWARGIASALHSIW